MGTFCIEMDGEDLKNKEKLMDLNEIMSLFQDEQALYITQLAEKLNVTEHCAQDVAYLRTRSRHTQELEEQLIELHKSGNPPNIFEFG